MLGKDAMGEVEEVRSNEPSSGAYQALRFLAIKCWEQAGVRNWKRWTRRETEPLLPLLKEAYELGRKEERECHVTNLSKKR